MATSVALLVGLAACQTVPETPHVAAAPPAEQGQPQAPDPADAADAARLQSMIDAALGGDKAFRVEGNTHVRHIQSGMTCDLSKDSVAPLAHLFVFPAAAVGDDVGCDRALPDGKMTVFATRKGHLSFDDYVAGTVNSMRRMFPSGISTAAIVPTYPDMSNPRAFSFDVTLDGHPYVTTAWIAEEGDWFVTVRSTYPAEAKGQLEVLSAITIIPARLSIRSAGGR
ncbi:hypothetical protein [Zavarzinia sp.]|uniref:hypothetical protein n=1 Tax=Zavarzinia sp. TaxID=2027920 RepID=UPI003BB6C953